MTSLLRNRNPPKRLHRLLGTVLFVSTIFLSGNGSFSNSWDAVRYPRFVQIADAQRDCDALAGSPSDRSRPTDVAGVPFSEIDAARAEAACRRATQERPSPQIFFQLGRALDAGHKDTEAVTNYRAA